MEARQAAAETGGGERVRAGLGARSVVLVGMPGAGKTSIGRRLAQVLHLPFIDADAEIEKAANQSIAEIFEHYGEAHFREGERRVVARLLASGPSVIATGGGAYVCGETRRACREQGITVWLKAELPVLLERVRKKSNRPLLAGPDAEGALRRLLEAREPIYGEADIVVMSRESPHGQVVADIVAALERRLVSPPIPVLY